MLSQRGAHSVAYVGRKVNDRVIFFFVPPRRSFVGKKMILSLIHLQKLEQIKEIF